MPIPQTVTLTVDGRLLQLIYQGLDELPGKIGREAFTQIQQQVAAHLQAANEADQKNAQRAAKALSLLEEHEKPKDIPAYE